MRHSLAQARSGPLWVRDTAIFNRWLCISRLRAAAAIAVFFPALSFAGLVDLDPVAILGVTAGLCVFSVAALAAGDRVARSRTFLCAQMAVDLAGVTVGIGVATHGEVALLARPIYALVVVPASLVSVPIGLATAAGATVGHAILLAIDVGASRATFSSFAFLGPAFLYFLIAQQAFFYGGHLREKNRALEELADRLESSQRRLAAEGRLAAELVEIARTLSATLDQPAPLASAILAIRDRLWADWGAIFGVDDAGAFRLLGVTDPDVAASDMGRLDLPLASWPAIAGLARSRTLSLEGPDVARIPASLTGNRPLASALVAGLYGESTMVGFVAVGYGRPLGDAREWAGHLLAGIAEHASVVLQNARLLEEVRAASALKSEFVGAVSHELRSPLNVILGYLEMVLDEGLGPLTASQADALRRAQIQGAAFLEMVEALLDLNRIEAGRLPLERSIVLVEAVLAAVCAQLERTARKPAVRLRLDVAPDLPAIESDVGKLKTIFRNLVHNALKFTDRGDVVVRAKRTSDGRIAIVVEDTGCGIPADALSYVFEMFRQVPGARGGGVGLGLHIVRRLVDAIGGTVSVESAVGSGTRFTVLLPTGLPVDPHAATEPRDAA
ncbi:MAG TPA: HAMP domain-containing sensor histidine kinase [Candidatus Binatia bacterium]|nr:HAMP domain-containing sensor histidine kinase [Candidatus Binatia bacterium]